ncbi:hypothetical protein A2U01_0092161, partial [Trifolium medium]|nr:hypothetical protein [Trifolium medium]
MELRCAPCVLCCGGLLSDRCAACRDELRRAQYVLNFVLFSSDDCAARR